MQLAALNRKFIGISYLNNDKGGGTVKASGRLISGYNAGRACRAARKRQPPPLATAQAPYTQPTWQQAAYLPWPDYWFSQALHLAFSPMRQPQVTVYHEAGKKCFQQHISTHLFSCIWVLPIVLR